VETVLCDVSTCPQTLHWFVGAGLAVEQPFLLGFKTSTSGQSSLLGRLESFDFDWTVAPTAELGYRFNNGSALVVSYRSLFTRGRQEEETSLDPLIATAFTGNNPTTGDSWLPGSQEDRVLRGRLEENWLDLDFQSRQHGASAGPAWRWTAGLRLASLYTAFRTQDSFTETFFQLSSGAAPLGTVPITVWQGASQRTLAIGPHLGMEGSWGFGATGLSLFARGDGGALFGGTRQRYDLAASAGETDSANGGTPLSLVLPPVSGTTSGPAIIPTAKAQVGLNWTVPVYQARLGLSLGYGVDTWWFLAVGKGAADNALFKSFNQLNHGPFVNCQFDF
jgi:hypothetical protein